MAFSTAPQFSTVRVNLCDIRKSPSEIKEYAISLLGPDFEAEFHPQYKEVLIITHKSYKKTETDGNYGQIAAPSKCVVVGGDCGNAVLRGAHVFSVGVVAIDGDAGEGDVVSVYADIKGEMSRGSKCKKQSLELDAEQFVFVGNGTLLVNREDIFGSIRAQDVKGIAIRMLNKLLPSLNNLPSGLFFPQNFPSLFCSRVVDPSGADWVLDMCAAPGGKAGHLAYLMKTNSKESDPHCGGKLIAIDRTKSKVDKMSKHFKEWNLENTATAFCADSSKSEFVNLCLNSNDLQHAVQLRPQMFDKILLDAPCSGLGKRPYLQRDIVKNKLGTFHTFQRKFIKNAVQLLKPGGVLVYSTCTTVLDENENQVNWVLENVSDKLKLVPCAPNLNKPGRSNSELKAEMFGNMVQYFPPDKTDVFSFHPCEGDTVGFFVAKFVKL
ncbi:tRNA (cytosine(72)-C(5))-methyltransferase NSUN6-like isoform X2 [Symsagittifera roscoffensis]|uniref:tRNA (cytosine(72)-C(5))-methyltransferase NSUN6-like isoform X2 n=1 Tax=Symsagittifera roscoffensis TaxID=84072 RepID=UPI00307BA225